MAELDTIDLTALGERLVQVESYLHLEDDQALVAELEAKSAEPGFWDDTDAARAR